MEFHENKAKAPFTGIVQLWQAVRTRWLKKADPARVTADGDERLRDIGLRRGGMWSDGENSPSVWGRGENLSVAFCY